MFLKFVGAGIMIAWTVWILIAPIILEIVDLISKKNKGINSKFKNALSYENN